MIRREVMAIFIEIVTALSKQYDAKNRNERFN